MLVYYFFEVIKLKDFFEILKEWGPTTSTAFISAISALYLNKKSIDANIKAKSRIKWIQKVRSLTVEFLSRCDSLLDYVAFRPENYATPQEKMEYEKRMRQVINSEIALKIFFPYLENDYRCLGETHSKIIEEMKNSNCNEEMNAKIVYLLEEISTLSREGIPTLDDDELCRADVKEHFDTLPPTYRDDVSYAVSRYLKIEWDRAKNGD